MRTAILPSDISDAVVAITGDPSKTISFRNVKGTSSGIVLYPIETEVTLDGYGNGTITVTPVSGTVSVAGTVAWNPVPDYLSSTGTITSVTTAPSGRYLRQIAKAIGTAFKMRDGALITEYMRAIGKLLADADSTLRRGIDQVFADTVSDMADEWETMLGLTVDKYGLLANRVAKIAAKWRSRRGGTINDILEAVRVIDPSAATYENSSINVYATNIRNTWLFAVQVASALWNDPTKRGAIISIIDSMKPAHTGYNLAVTVGFLTDDSASLTDRDVLSS